MRQVAKPIGGAPGTASQWTKMFLEGGDAALDPIPNSGGKARLGEVERAKLRALLHMGARASGFATDLWTLRRVRAVITAEFGVTWTAKSGSGVPFVVAAIERANARPHEVAQGAPAWVGMGTTTAAVLACGNRVVLAHVGDCRIYRLRERQLSLLTEDHSLFNEFVRHGFTDPDHPERFARRHVITRAVGTKPTVEVDARLIDAAPGDTFLIRTDGLCGVVPHQDLPRCSLST
jgi:protein phosphatase